MIQRKNYRYILFLIILTLVAVPVKGDTTIRPTVVVDYEIDPAVFMPGDNGTVTITLENKADGEVYVQEDDETFDMNAYISSVIVGGDKDIDVLDIGYSNIGLLGPGDTIKLVFNIQVKSNASNGVHFLYFDLIGGSNMDDFNYKIPITVDDRNIQLIMANYPSVVINEVSTISVDVANIRPNSVSNVIVKPIGKDISFTPSEFFIGTISAGNKSNISFNMNTVGLNPGSKDISFLVSYYNGNNYHSLEGQKTSINVMNQSELLLSDISIENIGSKYTITGNLNNIGIKDVKNVVISILKSDNIEPLQPNVRYFIGSLEADDFGSFELSAQVNSLNISSIPVQIEYRNIDNAYTHVTESIDLESSIPDQKSQVLSNNTTILPIAVIVALLLLCVGIVGIIRHSWKKRENS